VTHTGLHIRQIYWMRFVFIILKFISLVFFLRIISLVIETLKVARIKKNVMLTCAIKAQVKKLKILTKKKEVKNRIKT